LSASGFARIDSGIARALSDGMPGESSSLPFRLELPPAPAEETGGVKAWRQPVVLRSYLPHPADRNPMFLETRVYQGSSGRVYPIPFVDRIAETAVEQPWQAVHIENAYLRLMILPQIGGRIHVGLDKTNGYDFFYRQNVIKPALVGLAGPWISGGVEFNWPQHHRPATFMPVETEIERHPDGSVTVWCSDHDPMQRMKGMHGVCLHPDQAVVELKVRLYNRTPYQQTFLWWANVATRVHEQYQSFFPPDVRYVADHAKRAITAFPHSDRPYYGVDYPARARNGVPEEEQPRQFRPDGSYAADDLSWYANIPVPTSYMITSTKEDFFGGYDHRAQAGVLHFADHHFAPGKKQWTWGNHEFGYAWDRSLTDDDGPYIELMAGVYTDNQPDFSFLAPGETKRFSQFWYPLQRIGPPQAASLQCALNLTAKNGQVRIGVQATRDLTHATVTLTCRGAVEATWTQDIRIGSPLIHKHALATAVPETDLAVTVEANGALLLRYAPGEVIPAPVPTVAIEPPVPSAITTNEELYLTGLHLSQYRHATRRPELYWQEALLRDPLDARANTALGEWHMQRGEFAIAEALLRNAMQRLTALNPNPADGRAFYLLGLTLRFMDRPSESYDAFSKAAWSAAWKSPAHYALAQADAAAGRWEAALEHARRSLKCDADNLNARNLIALALRAAGNQDEASTVLAQTRSIDPLDHWSRHLALAHTPADNRALLDLVWDYVDCGQHQTAIDLLRAANMQSTDGSVPLLHYTLGYLLHRIGRKDERDRAWQSAAAASPDYCFPHRLEEMLVLQAVIHTVPGDVRAPYYLGNLLYDRRRYDEAMDLWQRAATLDASFPTVHRNLGIALFNVRGDADAAVAAFDRAQAADPRDGRILYERDQLWKRCGVPPPRRLAELLRHAGLVATRDDLSVELATLYNQTGEPEQALYGLLSRNFQPWEGGEGLVLGQFVRARLLLARHAIAARKPADAITHLEAALHPPQSIGEARHLLANKSDIEYTLGVAHAAAGNWAEAERWWQRASREAGDFQQMSVLPISGMTYWRGAALEKMRQPEQADAVFHSIAAFADELDLQEPKIDYFATSLPTMLLFHEDLAHRNRVLAAFLRAQAAYGCNGAAAAVPMLRAVLALDSNHAGASDLLQQIELSEPGAISRENSRTSSESQNTARKR
jgi:tetratricopeptide (TPR) repeat protein